MDFLYVQFHSTIKHFILKKDTLLCIPFREDLLCHRV